MSFYRIDLLDEHGAAREARAIECDHDDDAIDRAGQSDYPLAMAVWQDARLVAHFPPWPARAHRFRTFRTVH